MQFVTGVHPDMFSNKNGSCRSQVSLGILWRPSKYVCVFDVCNGLLQ